MASLLAHDNRKAADTLLDHALTLAMQALAEGDTQVGTPLYMSPEQRRVQLKATPSVSATR